MSKNKTSFQKGKSGNPRGRPKGSKNGTTMLKEALKNNFDKALENHFEKIMKTLVAKAEEGDMQAIKMIMDRVVPVTKAVEFGSKGDKNLGITIKIGNMQPENQEDNVIDITPEEVKK